MNTNQAFAGAGLVVAATAVVAGLYISGSPTEQRLLRLDERRVEDLSGLAVAIDAYHSGNSTLPATLDGLLEVQRLRSIPVDPATGDPYEYELTEGNEYRLCAVFSRPSEASGRSDFWQHEAGRWCFTIAPRASMPAISPGPAPVPAGSDR